MSSKEETGGICRRVPSPRKNPKSRTRLPCTCADLEKTACPTTPSSSSYSRTRRPWKVSHRASISSCRMPSELWESRYVCPHPPFRPHPLQSRGHPQILHPPLQEHPRVRRRLALPRSPRRADVGDFDDAVPEEDRTEHQVHEVLAVISGQTYPLQHLPAHRDEAGRPVAKTPMEHQAEQNVQKTAQKNCGKRFPGIGNAHTLLRLTPLHKTRSDGDVGALPDLREQPGNHLRRHREIAIHPDDRIARRERDPFPQALREPPIREARLQFQRGGAPAFDHPGNDV